jgi:hypothetical protein
VKGMPKKDFGIKDSSPSGTASITTVAERLEGAWSGKMHTIAYTLPSERKKKYAEKLRLLFHDYTVNFKDAILDTITQRYILRAEGVYKTDLEKVELLKEGKALKAKSESKEKKKTLETKKEKSEKRKAKDKTLDQQLEELADVLRIKFVDRIIYEAVPEFDEAKLPEQFFDLIMASAKKIITEEVKDQNINVWGIEWIIDLYKNYLILNANLPIDHPKLGSKGGLQMQIKLIESDLDNPTITIDEKKTAKEQLKGIMNEMNEIVDKTETMMYENYKNYYEWDILNHINENLSALRQTLRTEFHIHKGQFVDKTIVVVEDSDYQECIDQVRGIFDSFYIGLDRFMKHRYIQWINDPIVVEFTEKEPRAEIAKLFNVLEKKQAKFKDQMIKEESKIPSERIIALDRNGLFYTNTEKGIETLDTYQEIEAIWASIEDEDIEAIVEIMNAPNLTVEKREQKKAAYSRSIVKQVHWNSGLSPEDTKIAYEDTKYHDDELDMDFYHPRIYPYCQHQKRYRRAEHNIMQVVTLADSLLLHEISDALEVVSGGIKHKGWDALFSISFTLFDNIAASPETKERYIEIFKVDREYNLTELKDRIRESEELLKPDAIKEKGIQGIRRRIHGIEEDFEKTAKKDLEYFETLELYKSKDPKIKAKAEEKLKEKGFGPSSWMMKYDDTRKFVAIEELKEMQVAIKNLVEKMEEIKPSEEPEKAEEKKEEEKPEPIPQWKNFTLPNMSILNTKYKGQKELGIIMKDFQAVFKINTNLHNISPSHPESPQSQTSFKTIAAIVNEIKQVHSPPKGNEEEIEYVLFRKKGKNLLAADFLKQVEFYEKVSESDKKDGKKMAKLYVNLVNGFLTFIKNSGGTITR